MLESITIFHLAYTLFGLLIGSFLTVCIYRLPFSSLAYENELSEESSEDNPEEATTPFDQISSELPTIPMEKLSISSPARSFCPACFAQLKWWHNIPLLSWLMLIGKCQFCKKPIPIRYPLIEIATASASFFSFTLFGLNPTGAIIFIFCCALIIITVIDYDYYIIPNVISIPGTLIGFGLSIINHFFHVFSAPIVLDVWSSLLGVLAGAGFLLFVSEFYLRLRKIEGLGMGDVKLLAMTGALFGPECSLFTIFIGSLLGALVGGLLIVVLRRKMTHPLPFGPYLSAATFIYIFGGPDIVLRTAEIFGHLVRGEW